MRRRSRVLLVSAAVASLLSGCTSTRPLPTDTYPSPPGCSATVIEPSEDDSFAGLIGSGRRLYLDRFRMVYVCFDLSKVSTLPTRAILRLRGLTEDTTPQPLQLWDITSGLKIHGANSRVGITGAERANDPSALFSRLTGSAGVSQCSFNLDHWHVTTEVLAALGEPTQETTYLDLLRRWNRPIQAAYEHRVPWDEFDVTACLAEKAGRVKWVIFGIGVSGAGGAHWWGKGAPPNARPQLVLLSASK